jgi:hypothetical protein
MSDVPSTSADSDAYRRAGSAGTVYLQCVARLSFDKNAREARTTPRKPGLHGAASSTGLRSDLVD